VQINQTANPLTADSAGNYTICAKADEYVVQVSGAGFSTLTQPFHIIPNNQSNNLHLFGDGTTAVTVRINTPNGSANGVQGNTGIVFNPGVPTTGFGGGFIALNGGLSGDTAHPGGDVRINTTPEPLNFSVFRWQVAQDGTVNQPASQLTTAPVTVNTATASDQNLAFLTMPANCCTGLNKTLRYEGYGQMTNQSGGAENITIKLKLCSVSGCGAGTVLTLGSVTLTTFPQVTNTNFEVSAYITTTTAVTSQTVAAFQSILKFYAKDLSPFTFISAPTSVGTIDGTGNTFLQLTVSFSTASASNTMTQNFAASLPQI
jgi:hypothetical protein